MNWNLDPSHTNVSFAVRHLMFATVRGHMNLADGTVQTDDNGKLISFEANINPATVNTGDAQRDGHLQSPDFFDVANHPSINFKSTSVTSTGNDNYTVSGDLTIRGTSKPVQLTITFNGSGKDPWGNTKASAEATSTINRKDWGLVWNQALETGGVLVSDEVKITIDAQAAQVA